MHANSRRPKRRPQGINGKYQHRLGKMPTVTRNGLTKHQLLQDQRTPLVEFHEPSQEGMRVCDDGDSLVDEDPPEGSGSPVCHEQEKLLTVHSP